MPRKRPLPAPDRLFDRTWRPGRPFRPRVSLSRRWAMLIVFITLSGIIGTYWYVTDANRVREKAKQYLSGLLGGRVEIGRATLSIFEGFRLDNVHVYVDTDPTVAEGRPDSELFSAETLKIDYSPRALLAGKIEATGIVAIDPHVKLTEDPATHRWNYGRLTRTTHVSGPSMSKPPPALPEVSLRNAQVDYSQVRPDGSFESQGSIKIEGLLSPIPDAPERYHFKVQSRGGKSELLGPEVNGVIDLSGKTVTASLHRFEFGRDIQAMLPAQVRTWWEEHGLAGKVEIPELTCSLPAEGKPYRVRVQLDGVTLTVQPEELLGRDDIRRRRWAADAFDVMRVAGLNTGGFVDRVASFVVPSPVALRGVTGEFVFEEDGIDLHTSVLVEGNRINVAGHYDGYNVDAPASMRLTSSDDKLFNIPADPKYMSSLPPNVCEVYGHFKPQGSGSFWVQYDRPTAGGRPEITGELSIADGGFQFDRFPYPLRRARGKISLERDAHSGEDVVRITDLKGHGLTGGPNEKSLVEIDGQIGPFHPDLGVNVTVRGHNVSSEPTLTAAFPEPTRKALRVFDAPGKGAYPQFKGTFTTTINRAPERKAPWTIRTDIHLDDARGALVVFPYLMSGVTGDITVLDDHVEIHHAEMKRGEATLALNGRVDWGREPGQTGGPSMRPALNFTARGVPIDRDLLDALPENQRAWLRKLGVAGRFDLDGTVGARPAEGPNDKSDAGFAFDIGLRDCTITPRLNDDARPALANAKPAVTNINGKLKLSPQRVIFSELSGRRGEAAVTTRGSVTWESQPPQVALVIDATNLLLDRGLYDLLPDAARKGWDQVQPQGTLDARVTYSGAPNGGAHSGDATAAAAVGASAAIPGNNPEPPTMAVASAGEVSPATASSASSDSPSAAASSALEVMLTPRKLSATPRCAPYRLDEVTGAVVVTPGRVTLRDVAGQHGAAVVRVAGTGEADPDGEWRWSLRLSGDHMLVDDDLRRAAPSSVTALLQSSQMAGTVAIDFSKLDVTPAARPAAAAPAAPSPASSAPPTTAPRADAPTDVDFALKLGVADSSMNVGVPLAHVTGSADLAGSTRNGKLVEFNGQLDASSLSMAERPLTDLHADLGKIVGTDAMQLKNVRAKLAGGDLAGQFDWTSPDVGSGRYAMNLMLRNADVRDLAGDSGLNGDPDTKKDDIRGQMSASLALEGVFDQPGSRRGRGDVLVNGRQLYQIPLVLGLLQITNLALPITSPFNEATCRYTVDGGRVTFENIELRAKEMVMQGSGHLDFDTKKVRMTFVTQNQTWPKLPVIGDLIQGARNELLQIHIRGTITEPKVSAAAMNTLTTTIDEVFRGANPPPEAAAPKVKKTK